MRGRQISVLAASLLILAVSTRSVTAESSEAGASAVALARDTAVTPALDSAADSDAAIRALEEQERVAVLDQEFAALERIWAEGFIVNSPFNRIAPNRAGVLDIFRQGMAH